MKQEITFILPTRNRRAWVKRAIDSCLACNNNMIAPRVIVIDGQSNDGTFDDLQETYSDNARVELLQNSKTDGFMATCYQGVDLVKTRFVTFMYDDDVLSPYFSDMISHMLKCKRDFVMGYGATFEVDDLYPFRPILNYNDYKRLQLLLGYFGRKQHVRFSGLPVSPICCVTTIDLLRKWMTYVTGFAGKNRIRKYFMLKRNIGPDLMIYLSALLDAETDILVASSVVAQFSMHPSSMSIRYNKIDMRIGYWLARIWAFERLCEAGHRKEAANCAGYLMLYGINIIFNKIKNLDRSWLGSLCMEVMMIFFKTLRYRIGVITVSNIFSILYSRVKGETYQTTPV